MSRGDKNSEAFEAWFKSEFTYGDGTTKPAHDDGFRDMIRSAWDAALAAPLPGGTPSDKAVANLAAKLDSYAAPENENRRRMNGHLGWMPVDLDDWTVIRAALSDARRINLFGQDHAETCAFASGGKCDCSPSSETAPITDHCIPMAYMNKQGFCVSASLRAEGDAEYQAAYRTPLYAHPVPAFASSATRLIYCCQYCGRENGERL